MNDDRMALKALLEKASDTELLSEMLTFMANRLMSLDAETACIDAQIVAPSRGWPPTRP